MNLTPQLNRQLFSQEINGALNTFTGDEIAHFRPLEIGLFPEYVLELKDGRHFIIAPDTRGDDAYIGFYIPSVADMEKINSQKKGETEK